MKPLKACNLTLATAIAVLTFSLTTPANAACTNSVWAKISGNSFANKIFGRQCGANMSVRFTGAVNTGWIAMHGGANQFSATFVDNNVTTKIRMQTNGPTMHVNYTHIANGGGQSLTQGNYDLVSMQ